MAWFRKVKAGLVTQDITNFVGEIGNVFFNIETGEFRLSDGITPGGLPVSGGGGGTASAISDLTDVDLAGLANNNILVYNSSTMSWLPQPNVGGGSSGPGQSIIDGGDPTTDFSIASQYVLDGGAP